MGVGFVAGIDYTPSRDTSIGIGFRSAIDHTLEGHVTLYGMDEAPIKASITLPEMLSLGVRQAVSPTTRLLAEAEWVNWSRLNVIPVELKGPFLGLPAGATAANLDFPLARWLAICAWRRIRLVAGADLEDGRWLRNIAGRWRDFTHRARSRQQSGVGKHRRFLQYGQQHASRLLLQPRVLPE